MEWWGEGMFYKDVGYQAKSSLGGYRLQRDEDFGSTRPGSCSERNK